MGAKKRLLLHVCCGACLSYTHQSLKKENFDVIVYFYNPSVHGRAEYNKRLSDIKKYCTENQLELLAPEYDVQEFFAPLMPYQDKSSIKYINDKKRWQTKRCQFCYDLLMTKTASEAKNRKIPNFSTTMLVTPYKDHEELLNIGLELEQEIGIKFFYRDFRKGYWQGRNYARNHKMYLATYCGCSYSLEEGLLE